MTDVAEINFESWSADPLRAGTAIYSRVHNDNRPGWAASILAECCERVPKVPEAIAHVLDLSAEAAKWELAHDAFSAVRQLTLAAERRPIEKRDHLLLYVAENTAKVIYNAFGASAPFDRDSGAWLVRCAKEYADCVNDVSFPMLLWRTIASVPIDKRQS